MTHSPPSGSVEAGRDIYAQTVNSGVIEQRVELNLNVIVDHLGQLADRLAQPGSAIRLAVDGQRMVEVADGSALPLPPNLLEGFRLLAQATDRSSQERHRAYAAWLVTRQPERLPQLIAARDYYVPLPGRLSQEEEWLRPHFSERRVVGEGPQRQVERVPLADVTEAVDRHPTLVLLGAPGSGKTTVLHRLALNEAQTFLTGRSSRLPLRLTLADYRWQQEPEPLEFVRRHWQRVVGDDFVELVQSGHILLLADGLNEMVRLEQSGDRRRRAEAWERFFADYFGDSANHSRAVIASRDQADYDQPLGLPRVEIDPLGDEQLAAFLQTYLGEAGDQALAAIKRLGLLEQARTPYPLFILTQLYDPASGDLPPNRGQMFARYSRRLVEGERHAGHDWYEQEATLAALAELGYALQRRGESTVLPAAELHQLLPQQVRLSGRPQPIPTPPEAVFHLACQARLLIPERSAAAPEAHKFSHQLLQEQFAAQHLLAQWQASVDLTALWRTPRSHREMPPAEGGESQGEASHWDPLPPPPATGWEQTTILAAGFTDRADDFVRALLAVNPALAGRCLSEGAALVSGETQAVVQQALLQDLSAPALHRRARIQAGRVLAAVGDPRFEPVTLNEVKVILPGLVAVPGGIATIGSRSWPWDRQADRDERPRHRVEMAPFYLGRYPVTNAEYHCFIKAGGYDTKRYWTPTGWQWRQGELAESGPIEQALDTRRDFLENPKEIDRWLKEERITPDYADILRTLIQLSEEEVRQQLAESYAPQPHEQPYYWADPAYNQSNQPVVGVTWYEAMAYCAWLNERMTQEAKRRGGEEPNPLSSGGERTANGEWVGGLPDEVIAGLAQGEWQVRLPTEAEWEWAAGGPEHTTYPWGKKFDSDKANSLEGRMLGTTPVGAYPAGAAACGALDLSGNVYEWTRSLYWPYPYRANDGREEPPAEGRRAVRGGSWVSNLRYARVSSRNYTPPAYFLFIDGFRVSVAPVLS